VELTNKKLIFVSCGQLTKEEKELGSAVKCVIDETDDFEAYFAETVHDLTALAHHISDALHRCSGAISFLHNRGLVTDTDGDWGVRSSVDKSRNSHSRFPPILGICKPTHPRL